MRNSNHFWFEDVSGRETPSGSILFAQSLPTTYFTHSIILWLGMIEVCGSNGDLGWGMKWTKTHWVEGQNGHVSCQILIKLKRHQNFQLQMQSYALIFCKLLNQNLVRLSYFENLKIWNPILSEYFGKYIYLKSDLIWNFKKNVNPKSDPIRNF